MVKVTLHRFGTNLGREVTAGIIVFTTTAFNLFLIPSMLAEAGAPVAEATTSVALVIALACILMGLFADRPLVVAPGIATTAYLVYTLILGAGLSWSAAIAVAFCAGLLFLGLASLGLHSFLYHAIPDAIRVAFLAGLGFFLMIIGLRNVGMLEYQPGTMPILGDMGSPAAQLTGMGSLFIFGLTLLRVRMAFLLGLVYTLLLAWWLNLFALPKQLVSAPVWPKSLLITMDFTTLFSLPFLSAVLGLFLVMVLGVAGTLAGLERLASPSEKGEIFASRPTYVMAASGTVLGALLGVSPNVVLGQSAIALQGGGRGGLSAIVTGVLFALALFFTPLFAAVPAAAVAPLLIAVGMLMMRGVTGVSWRASEDAVPGLVTVMATVLTMDIASGLAFGMGSYVICYYLAGRKCEMHQSSYLLTLVLGIYLVLYAQ